MATKQVELLDLKLGDVVRLNEGRYMDATVVEIPAKLPGMSGVTGKLVLRRPYLIGDDFSHAGRHGGLAIGFGIWAEDIVFEAYSTGHFHRIFERKEKTR